MLQLQKPTNSPFWSSQINIKTSQTSKKYEGEGCGTTFAYHRIVLKVTLMAVAAKCHHWHHFYERIVRFLFETNEYFKIFCAFLFQSDKRKEEHEKKGLDCYFHQSKLSFHESKHLCICKDLEDDNYGEWWMGWARRQCRSSSSWSNFTCEDLDADITGNLKGLVGHR